MMFANPHLLNLSGSPRQGYTVSLSRCGSWDLAGHSGGRWHLSNSGFLAGSYPMRMPHSIAGHVGGIVGPSSHSSSPLGGRGLISRSTPRDES
jgi:hypothetical protein